ncbi:MAG: tripartite tricarboxylate transporter substrate binding protein [Deltaproteobacteria bacterium]|nr:tripartite tricarboxylate transporter substrate binding protein [Deltaproteobacteria bacterium]
MLKRIFLVVAFIILFSPVHVRFSEAAAYPSRPIEIVAPSNPGGGWDALARTLKRTLEDENLCSQPISVLNKPGGGGAAGMAYMNMKKGDDYELIVYSPPLIINSITKQFPHRYSVLTPLAKLITDYQVFIVKADSPYKTFHDLLRELKKNPGAMKFGGGSNPGSMDHLAFCKVAKEVGINARDLSYVAFSGGGEALTTLLCGNVFFVSSGAGEVLKHIKAGTVRALAITSGERRGGPLKDVPTLKELGIETVYEVWRGVFGPPGMSREAQDFWARTLKTMVGAKTWKVSLEKLQWVDSYADANSFAAFLTAEERTYLEMLIDLGFVK